jgi:phenylpropionate dioxygenase-like ring-hydroxylating dioxygenase large terminal subunit
MVTTLKNLVSPDGSLLDRRIYTDPDIYQQELENIFGRCWLFVGHDSLVSQPHDFIAQYMGEDPILVTRDANGKLHAFLNMCRHRGNRVCRADKGNTPSFMCTYHGWTFATDGKLVGVPGYKEAYFEELDRSQWGLVEARIDSYKGLMFACWDKEAPSLYDYLGDMGYYLDLLSDRRSGGSEVLGGMNKWVFKANWKIPGDNFAGDAYHVPISHGSVSFVRSPSLRRGINSEPNQVNASPGNGHSQINTWIGLTDAPRFGRNSPVIDEYRTQTHEEMKARLGEQRARAGNSGIATVFPNCSHLGGHMIRTWHPRGQFATEVWSYCLVDKDAPQGVKDAERKSLISSFSSGGLFEQDDGDNFDQVTKSGLSFIGRRILANLQMGLGHEFQHEAAPGVLGASTSESNQRAFYKRWAEMMEAPAWSGISINPRTRV